MKKIIKTPECLLEFEHKTSYLYAIANGKREDANTCIEIWKQILAESKLNQSKKILLECKIQGIGTVSELRELILEVSELVDDEYIAFIDETPEHFQTNRLAEITASNLGLNVKFFNSIGEAKEWLLLK